MVEITKESCNYSKNLPLKLQTNPTKMENFKLYEPGVKIQFILLHTLSSECMMHLPFHVSFFMEKKVSSL